MAGWIWAGSKGCFDCPSAGHLEIAFVFNGYAEKINEFLTFGLAGRTGALPKQHCRANAVGPQSIWAKMKGGRTMRCKWNPIHDLSD